MPATKPRAYQVYDIDWKQAVRALSDSNINLASPGALVIDAVVLDPYDRVLLTAQTNATENGIYQVNAAQTLLVPAPDWVNINSGLSSAVNSGLTVTVTEGADYAQTTWTLTNPNPIVIGVTAIVFEPVPEASDRIGNIYFDGATIELANGASETAIAIRPNGASGLAGITIPDDAAANSFSLNIFNFANRGNVKIDTNSGDWVFDYSGNLTATGYITANYFVGDGGLLSNISGSGSDYSNANVANYLPTYSGNLASLTGNVTTNANISGSYILGNGRQLSGIDRISNGTSNIVILDNGNVEITSGSETWFFINSGAMHCPPVSTIYAEGTGEMSLQVANNTIAEATINLGYNGPESTYIQIVAEAEDERLAQFELTANDGSNNFARIVTFDGNSQNYFWKFSGDGIFLVPGDIIPVANGSRSLGNVTNQGNDLYVSNNTIYLGNVPLAVTSANGLTIGGQAVLSNGSNAAITTTGNITANYFIGNGSQLTGITANTGNVTFSNQIVLGTGTNDGSGGLYLAPGTDSIANSAVQYLRVRGGDFVTHIHLDTGNNAFYDQYFGNDNKFVKLEAGAAGNVVVGTDDPNGNSYNWTFGSNGRLTFPGTPRIDTDSNNFEVQAAESISLEANAVVNIYTDSSGNAYQWQFGDDGNLTLPGSINSTSTIIIDNRASGNSADINLYAADDILIQARDRTLGSTSEGGDINIFAGDSAEDSDSSGGDVQISAGDGGAANVDFGGSGGFITIQSGQGGAATGNSGYSAESGGALTLGAGDAGSNNGNIDLGAAGGDVYIGAGDSTGNTDDGGGIYITSGAAGTNALAGQIQLTIPPSDSGSGGVWIFDGYGNLTAPGNVSASGNISGAYIKGNGSQLTGITANTGDITFVNTTISAPNNDDINIQALNSDGVVSSAISMRPGDTYTRLEQWSSQDSQSFSTADWTTGTYTTQGGQGAVQFTNAANIINFVDSLIGVGQIYFSVNGGPLLVWDGTSSGGGTITFYTPTLPATDPTTVTTFEYYYSYYSQIEIDYDAEEFNIDTNNVDLTISTTNQTDIGLDSSRDLDMRGNGSVTLRNSSTVDSIQIQTDTGNTNRTWAFGTDGNLTVPGNVIFANNYVYSGNTFKSPNSTVGNLNAFAWQFSDNSIGNDTITLQWNLFDTTTSQWYLSTDSQTNAWTLDSATKKFSYSPLNASPGSALTFGNAAANGTGAVNDIELTSSDSNVYIRANNSSWQFGDDGNLTLPGGMTINGNINTLGAQTALLQPTDDLPLSFIASGANGTVTSYWAEDIANLMSSNIAAVYTPLQNTQTVRIVTGTNGGNIAIYDFDKDGVFSTAQVSATGNVSADYLVVSGGIRATGASPAPTLSGFSSISTVGATGNITASGNLIANVGITTLGNVTGNYFIGNGSQLTGLSATYGNANVANFLAAYGSNTIVTTGNITAGNLIGNISITGNVTGTSANVTLVAGSYNWTFNNTGNLTLPGNTFSVNYANNTPVDVVTRFEGSWTVPVGNSTQSFTVPINNTYQLWVLGNIPNGIIVYNATVSVSNTNVPVIGQQFAWNYEGGGNILMFNSIPAQIIGTAGAISNAAPAVANTNVFTFSINNAYGNTVTVNYGYTKIS